ncbi:hypothetical protein SDC9_91515 [bioreactor metagenome]|uniref:Uncharacterized protein n=1 Tax=bioreactor metagenome TaxID=1076179 RepID=A0A645A1W1_9ZZZZ
MSLESTLATTGYPSVHPPYGGSADTYITFHLVADDENLYADGEAQAEERLYSVDLFTRVSWESKILSIKAILKTAGYRIQSIGPEIYEVETKLYHIPMLVLEDA